MQQHNTSKRNSSDLTNKGFSGVLRSYYCPHSETKNSTLYNIQNIYRVPIWLQSLKGDFANLQNFKL